MIVARTIVEKNAGHRLSLCQCLRRLQQAWRHHNHFSRVRTGPISVEHHVNKYVLHRWCSRSRVRTIYCRAARGRHVLNPSNTRVDIHTYISTSEQPHVGVETVTPQKKQIEQIYRILHHRCPHPQLKTSTSLRHITNLPCSPVRTLVNTRQPTHRLTAVQAVCTADQMVRQSRFLLPEVRHIINDINNTTIGMGVVLCRSVR